MKLDELIRANSSARNELVDLEDLTDEEMDVLHKEFLSAKRTSLQIEPRISKNAREKEEFDSSHRFFSLHTREEYTNSK